MTLLLRGKSNDAIRSTLAADDLPCPGDDALDALRADHVPKRFKYTSAKGKAVAEKFGVTAFFDGSPEAEQSLNLLRHPRAREMTEAGFLTGVPTTAIAQTLKLYLSVLVPESIIELYRSIFFDITRVTRAQRRVGVQERVRISVLRMVNDVGDEATARRAIRSDARSAAMNMPSSPLAWAAVLLTMGYSPSQFELPRVVAQMENIAALRVSEALLKGQGRRLEKAIPAILEALTLQLSTQMLSDLKRQWGKEARIGQRELSGFRRRLHKRWKAPLDLSRLLLTICRELGADVNQELTHAPSFARRRVLVDVLRRLHARACQVAAEVLSLLETGFADGAMARWRTLHELSVTTCFVAEHGEDLAKRYVAHQAVESKRAADEYQRCQPLLGYPSLEAGELAELQQQFDKVVARYGTSFKEPYGWAADHLKNPKPNFAQIEEAAKIHRLRPHYRFASHNVHANPKGAFFRLGLLPGTPLLLAGPSNSGLVEPGQCAALSLAQVTTVFGTLHPSLDNNVTLRVIAQLVEEIEEAFGAAQKRLVDDEEAFRARGR
jgi:hypothetical protein